MSDLIVVKELDARYSIVIGYEIRGGTNPNMVFNNEDEAVQRGNGKFPVVGFVIYDKETGGPAGFSDSVCFASCDVAIGCYELNVHPKEIGWEGTPVLHLDENYAMALAKDDLEDEDCVSNSYAFYFYDLRSGKIVFPEDRFETCEEAISYYHENLLEKESEISVIADFEGRYAFLSNGFDQKDFAINFSGLFFRTAEGAFQSCKCPEKANLFCYCNAREAKQIGRTVPLNKDWDEIRDIVMYDVLMAKFAQNDELRQKLLDTGDDIIEPHNMYHDNYWGSCDCAECASKEKKNKLGILLMRVRRRLQN